MKLQDMLAQVECIAILGERERDILQLCIDSRQVQPGGLFVALPGSRVDGHTFVNEVITRGAVAIVVEKVQRPVNGVTFIQVPEARRALARLASNFYGRPAESLGLIGITGTNGKTTTASLLSAILNAAGQPAGLIGTIANTFRDFVQKVPYTTPDPISLHAFFQKVQQGGGEWAVMEVSSHALALERVYGLRFQAALFTNLTQDHLDFHGTFEHYFESKARLFSPEYLCGRPDRKPLAVINLDDAYGHTLLARLEQSGQARIIGVSRQPNPDFLPLLPSKDWVRPVMVESAISGSRLTVRAGDESFLVESPLIGSHNLANLLAAIALAIGLNIPIAAIQAGIGGVINVAGRMERVTSPASPGPQVFIDYAHTPDAIKLVLASLREIPHQGRIITVFGCGGNRDRKKRPMMGVEAYNGSDITIVTSDNPRFEAPLTIIDDIVDGLRQKNTAEWLPEELLQVQPEKGLAIVPDRHEAIDLAMSFARPDDVVLIAGKGHENSQIIGNSTIPFSDRDTVEAWLKAHYA
jgi:UDP-N-acetylmuramoyl-L-alanyl-D-glutamate--2,6-diaminopimelate ligase